MKAYSTCRFPCVLHDAPPVQGLSLIPLGRVGAQVTMEGLKFTCPSQQLVSARKKRPCDSEKEARRHSDMTEKGPSKAEQNPLIDSHLHFPPTSPAPHHLSRAGVWCPSWEHKWVKGLLTLTPALGAKANSYSAPTEIPATETASGFPERGPLPSRKPVQPRCHL